MDIVCLEGIQDAAKAVSWMPVVYSPPLVTGR